MQTASTWLRPHLVGFRKRSDVERLPLADILLNMLSWEQRKQLDDLAPSHWIAPTGTRVAIDYSDPAAPTVRIRLQEVFGVKDSPRVAGIGLTFELLSPAQRPVQVTRTSQASGAHPTSTCVRTCAVASSPPLAGRSPGG